jgi:hypothetical protein
MESLLHHYGILTTEMVAVIRHVSKTSWRLCSIHWRVKESQSATRRLRVGTAHFHGVIRALKNQGSTTTTKIRRNKIISLPGHVTSLSWRVRSIVKLSMRLRTTSQNSPALHGDRGLQKMFVNPGSTELSSPSPLKPDHWMSEIKWRGITSLPIRRQ